MKTIEVDAATMRRALGAEPRKRAKRARATTPREERTGLSTLLRAGWSVQSPDAVRYRLYRGPLDTGLCESERAACDKAKELSR